MAPRKKMRRSGRKMMDHSMMEEKYCWGLDRLFFGIVILLLGVVFLGTNLGFLSMEFLNWWPILLVLWGLKVIL